MKKRLSTLVILAGLYASIYSTAYANTLEDAQQAIDKHDYPTAVIHLKNQLKKTPKNAQARFLLGSIYLQTGKLNSSLKELSRAHKLSPDDNNILFRYADALQASGKNKEIIELFKKPFDENKLESQRLTYLGYAHMSTNKLADASQEFKQANQLIESANAYNGLVTLALYEKDYKLADKLLAKSLSVEAEKATTLQLKAKLANLNKQYEQALSIYNDLIKKNANNLLLHLERAATLAILKKNEQSKADLKVILDKIKNHPQANFIKSQILLQEKDFIGAQEAAQIVINVAPQHMPAAFVLGAANFALKHYNQAEEYLTIYLASNPGNLKAQNLLANVYLAQGKTKQTLVILEGLSQEQLESDPLLLVTLGSAYIKKGDTKKGITYLSQAQKLAPDNQNIRKRLIAAQFQTGELGNAIDELKQLITIQEGLTDSEQTAKTNYLLIISYIKQKQFDKAEEKINQLLPSAPEDTKLLNLKALTEQLKGNTEKAIAQYNIIIEKDKANIPAYMGMARISALKSNWQESKTYFEKVIEINPEALKAYLGLAAIAEKQNQPEMTEQYFFDAIEQSKKNIPSQLAVASLLSQWYQKNKQPEKILTLAKKLDKQHPNENTVRSFLAQAQLINNKNERAERTIRTIITFDKKDVKHRVLLARLISQDSKRINEAMELIKEAKNIQPENQLLFSVEASLLISQNKYDEAHNLAIVLQEQFPDSAAGKLLEADIYRAQKKHEKALVIYQQVYKKDSSEKIFSAIIDMHLALKQQDKAISLLTEAVNKTPDDFASLFKLASLYHEGQQLEKAEMYYQRVLDKNPKHIISLNNLAWIKIDIDVKQAVSLAKQAYDLAPDSPSIIDTYGYFLARDAQYETGLELLKKAATDKPEDMDIQYHLAFTYEKLGQSDKAREILKKIVSSEQSFSEKNKAQELLQEVQ